MKTLVLLLLLALTARATDITFAWDASPDTSVTGYTLYAHTNALVYANLSSALVKVNAGTNLTAKVVGLAPPATWYFVATAVAGSVESDVSNTVIIQIPRPPANSRVVVIQYGVTLTNGFGDMGFFRLYIPPVP